MFSYNGTRIDTFRTMYQNTDGTPVLVASGALTDDRTGVEERQRDEVRIWPNPSSTGSIDVIGDGIEVMAVYDGKGAAVEVKAVRIEGGWRITLPREAGTYQLRLRVNGFEMLKRVVKE
jgi:hypothetical protein